MGFIFKSFFKTFWPFILEVFFKNKEVRDRFKDVHFLFKALLVLIVVGALITGAVHTLTSLLYATHDRYRVISGDYIELQEQYNDLLAERRDLARRATLLGHEVDDKGRLIEVLDNRVDSLKCENERLVEKKEALSDEFEELAKICEHNGPADEESAEEVRTNVIERLEGL